MHLLPGKCSTKKPQPARLLFSSGQLHACEQHSPSAGLLQALKPKQQGRRLDPGLNPVILGWPLPIQPLSTTSRLEGRVPRCKTYSTAVSRPVLRHTLSICKQPFKRSGPSSFTMDNMMNEASKLVKQPWFQKALSKVFKALQGCISGTPADGNAQQPPPPQYPTSTQPMYQGPPQQPAYTPSYPPILPAAPAHPTSYAGSLGQPAQQPAAYPPAAPPAPAPVPPPQHGIETGTDPSAAELNDLSVVGQKLWDLDDNRLRTGVDYTINVQDGKKTYENHDAAADRLFTMVSQSIWQRPTYRTLYALRDNYHAATGIEETETAQERQEVSDFLDAVMRTRPMIYAHKYLVRRNLAPANPAEFKKVLHQMWFSLYRRETQNDSCGFEHVFLGEIDNGEVSGFHNWIQFWVEESKGNVDYRGYIRPRNRGERVDANDRVLACQFTWQGKLKNVTTLFIGTSPEFELALYTLYFLAGSERNNITIDGYELCIRCYAIRSKYGDKVGSSFPELMAEMDDNHQ